MSFNILIILLICSSVYVNAINKNIKLITYNVGGGANSVANKKAPYEHLKNKLNVLTPSYEVIAFLQESRPAVGSSDTKYGPSNNQDVYTEIMKESKMFSMIHDNNYQSILTTLAPLPLAEMEIGQNIVPENTMYSTSTRYTYRRDTHVHKVNIDGKDVGIASIHLPYWGGSGPCVDDLTAGSIYEDCRYVFQHAYMKELVDKSINIINDEGLTSIILGGDFNIGYNDMKEYFTGPEYGLSTITKLGFTFKVTDGIWIDYVVEISKDSLISTPFTSSMSCVHGGKGGSDHWLVECDMGSYTVQNVAKSNAGSSVNPLIGESEIYLAMNDERLQDSDDREWVYFIRYDFPSYTDPGSKCVQGLLREYRTKKYVYQTLCDYKDSNQAFLCVKEDDETGSGHWASLAGYKWIVNEKQKGKNVDCLWRKDSMGYVLLDSSNDYLGYEGNILNGNDDKEWAETDIDTRVNKAKFI